MTTRFLLAGILMVVLLFYVRVEILSQVEPRVDQAAFARCVQEISAADHLLPIRQYGESWRCAMERDRMSIAHNVLIRIYNQPVWIFLSVGLSAGVVAAKVFGYNYHMLVIMMIAASVLSLYILSVTLVLPRHPRSASMDSVGQWGGLLAMAVGASTLYLHLFSALGVHNIGILAMLLFGLVMDYTLNSAPYSPGSKQWSRFKGPAAILCCAGVAMYSHWTNVLILPVATLIGLLFHMLHVKMKRQWAARALVVYSSALFILLVPWFLVGAAVGWKRLFIGPEQFAVVAGFRNILFTVPGRAVAWFVVGSSFFSIPGLVLGIVGTFFLGWKRRIWMPLAFVLAHFLLWSVLPGFSWNGSASAQRTYPYVLFPFSLGVGYLMAAAVGGELNGELRSNSLRRITALLLLGGMIGHIYGNAPGFISSDAAKRKFPEFWRSYFVGQGTLRPIIRDLDALLPEQSELLMWDYNVQNLFCLADKKWGEKKFLPAIASFWLRTQNQGIDEYLRCRRIHLDRTQPTYFLVGANVESSELQRQTCGSVPFLSGGESTNCSLKMIRSWDTHLEYFGGTIRLFKLDIK